MALSITCSARKWRSCTVEPASARAAASQQAAAQQRIKCVGATLRIVEVLVTVALRLRRKRSALPVRLAARGESL
jgi:hypothetical protein